MNASAFYLKPNIKFEPLVAQWYAWPHLFAPAPAALNLQRRYLDIMRKYIKAPHVHAAAVKNPALKGGPFIDLPAEHSGKVEKLLKETETNHADVFGFADAIAACQTMLRTRAKGGSLEGLYRDVPAALRGYVELVYDINNSAGMRLIEPLLYRSKYYKKSLQSIMLSPMETDYRPFILSTPRFVMDPASEMEWRVPFDDERIDYLVSLRETPRPLGEIVERLGVESADQSTLQTFLTDKPPVLRSDRRYRGPGVRIRYFGHACLLIETAEVSILMDPFLSYQYPTDVERFSVMDLPEKIDYVLLTHGHADHMSFEWLLQLRSKIGHIVFPQNEGGFLPDPSSRLILNQVGFKSTIALEELNHIDIPDGRITALPFLGEHGDLNIRSKTIFLIELKGKRMAVGADACNLEPTLYEHVRRDYGSADLLFLGMECDGAPFSWIYGPCVVDAVSREFDQERRLNGSNRERAWNIVKSLECKEVYTYAMGMEPWLGHIMALSYTSESPQIIESDKLLAECRSAGILAERPFGIREWLI